MATEGKRFRELVTKLEALPPERIAEAEDFTDFLRQRDRDRDRQLRRAVVAAAESSLQKVWDNPDDAIYDPR